MNNTSKLTGIFLLSALIVLSVHAQDNRSHSDSISNRYTRNVLLQTTDIVRYKLYPTQNIWNFIKLDTQTGKMWQVQFSLDSEKRFESVLNARNLVTIFENKHLSICNGEVINGRFALYPTQNTYNFILLDQISGQTYQVQWSFDEENRIVLPIN